ncbi:hypothetical protein [Ornithinimicrobium cryptoxanthini]|uniref:hypothetical protein n=1 Tax=Ornithinimicrobium cryptoxanthini TaxID=2934161 RepID=UPI00211846C3|nr:hypothetical protein [Ornithinimicrobium cryptoxanthini]
MDFLYNLTVVAHMLGLAALVGGYLVAVTRSAEGLVPNVVMVWGARVQLLSGLILVGIAEGALDDIEVNQMKIGVKLLVAIAVAALTEIAAAKARKGQPVAGGMVHAAGALAVVNVLVASLWK